MHFPGSDIYIHGHWFELYYTLGKTCQATNTYTCSKSFSHPCVTLTFQWPRFSGVTFPDAIVVFGFNTRAFVKEKIHSATGKMMGVDSFANTPW